ncbi:hypothetical protein GQ44DRAFT_735706 [Phaeosphaeriaceae sp. PMI808]|nr:hypothetical protein GQ44DRAFT_735706 [Phaeosphaeriaceae sp. PMI808]
MSSNTPKTMSSRLMTMKRSASKATASSPSTPNGPPSKKVRLSNGRSATNTPGTSDHEILQSALVAEEKKRQEALDKAAQHVGETKWVLSFNDPLDGKRQESLDVRQAGFAEIDAADTSEDDDDEEEEEVQSVRKQFGGGVKRKEKPVFVEKEDQPDGEVDSSSEEYDSDDPTAALIRETKREVAEAKRKPHDPKSPPGPHKPLNKNTNSHGMQSLSGDRRTDDRRSGDQRPRDARNVECFQCGQKGHFKSNCPKPRGSAGRGRGRR